jgi:hypothetical protein
MMQMPSTLKSIARADTGATGSTLPDRLPASAR